MGGMAVLTEDCGERRLWLEVIQRAVEDAVGEPPCLSNRKDANEKRADLRKRAICWLTKPSKGFDLVCEMAGVDSDVIREGMRKRLQIADCELRIAGKKKHGKHVEIRASDPTSAGDGGFRRAGKIARLPAATAKAREPGSERESHRQGPRQREPSNGTGVEPLRAIPQALSSGGGQSSGVTPATIPNAAHASSTVGPRRGGLERRGDAGNSSIPGGGDGPPGSFLDTPKRALFPLHPHRDRWRMRGPPRARSGPGNAQASACGCGQPRNGESVFGCLVRSAPDPTHPLKERYSMPNKRAPCAICGRVMTIQSHGQCGGCRYWLRKGLSEEEIRAKMAGKVPRRICPKSAKRVPNPKDLRDLRPGFQGSLANGEFVMMKPALKPHEIVMNLDFTGREDMLIGLSERARAEFRTPAMQVLFELARPSRAESSGSGCRGGKSAVTRLGKAGLPNRKKSPTGRRGSYGS